MIGCGRFAQGTSSIVSPISIIPPLAPNQVTKPVTRDLLSGSKHGMGLSLLASSAEIVPLAISRRTA
jgi:hypothetical protein